MEGGDHYTLIFEITNPRMTYTFGDSLYLDKEKEKKKANRPYIWNLKRKMIQVIYQGFLRGDHTWKIDNQKRRYTKDKEGDNPVKYRRTFKMASFKNNISKY